MEKFVPMFGENVKMNVPKDVNIGIDVDFKGQQTVLFCDRLKQVGKGLRKPRKLCDLIRRMAGKLCSTGAPATFHVLLGPWLADAL